MGPTSTNVLDLFKIIEKINDEIVEPQMEEGQAHSLIITANGDFIDVSFAGVVVWSSEENDPQDPQTMEKDIRNDMDRLMESFAKIPKLSPKNDEHKPKGIGTDDTTPQWIEDKPSWPDRTGR